MHQPSGWRCGDVTANFSAVFKRPGPNNIDPGPAQEAASKRQQDGIAPDSEGVISVVFPFKMDNESFNFSGSLFSVAHSMTSKFQS
jgi:hypothetical protein